MAERIRKLRVRLYDKDNNMLSDRLIDPDVEFRNGPKFINEGPIEVEFYMEDQPDVDNLIAYLGQLRGLIPIEKPISRPGKKPRETSNEAEHVSYVTGLVENHENPEGLIKALREEGFLFITLEYLEDLGFTLGTNEEDYPGFKFMVRLIRKAKNPLNNIYDPSVLIGIRSSVKLSRTSVIIRSGDETILEKDISEGISEKIVVPPKYRVKFPKYLTLDDRNKFRVEMEKLKEDPELKPTRFYARWVHDIAGENPEDMEFPRIDEIPNPYGN